MPPAIHHSDSEAPKRDGGSRITRRLAAFAAVVVLAGAVGVGGYLVGRSGGEDLDAARESGAAAGEKAGMAKGTREGYAAGFKKGRQRGFEQTFDAAYRAAYTKAFEDEGLSAPEQISVPAKDGKDE